MPRSKVDACMFCMANPCECEGAKPKSKPREKKAQGTNSALSPQIGHATGQTGQTGHSLEELPAAPGGKSDSQNASGSTLDIKAAMKKAASSDYNAELAQALVVLEPILHLSERRKWEQLLETTGSRAERWKARNGRH